MGIALAQTLLCLLVDDIRFRQLLKLIGGVAMAVILLEMVTEFDYGTYASELRRTQLAPEWDSMTAQAQRERLDRLFIEAETEAYIQNRAEALGVPVIGVLVVCDWSTEGFWFPKRADITVSEHVPAEGALAEALCSELGISEAEQLWELEGAEHGPE